jgi:UDP-glucose 4-epimerase
VKGKKVLVTGGAGFIGGTLATSLREHNSVYVYDSYARAGHDAAALRQIDGVEYLEGDVLDLVRMADAMRGCDVVIHAAGIAGIDTVGRSPVSTLRVNAVGTDTVLRAALEAQVSERVVCFSTSEIFGNFAFDVSETNPASIGAVGEPRWTYAASKVLAEHLAFSYWKEFGLPTVIVRPFNVYGPGQLGEGAIRKFATQALRGDDIVVNGDGNQIRSWCYIEDFVDGVMLCADHPSAVGESFNIGNARAVVTVLELARKIVELTGSASLIRHSDPLAADIQVRVPSVLKAKSLLGFEARVDLNEGLKFTLASQGQS